MDADIETGINRVEERLAQFKGEVYPRMLNAKERTIMNQHLKTIDSLLEAMTMTGPSSWGGGTGTGGGSTSPVKASSTISTTCPHCSATLNIDVDLTLT